MGVGEEGSMGDVPWWLWEIVKTGPRISLCRPFFDASPTSNVDDPWSRRQDSVDGHDPGRPMRVSSGKGR